MKFIYYFNLTPMDLARRHYFNDIVEILEQAEKDQNDH